MSFKVKNPSILVYFEHKFLSVSIKMSADGKPARGRTRILTDSTWKRNRKEVLANYNKTRINIGHIMTVGWNWMKRWEYKRMLKCKHQHHWTCSSGIGTCIINDAGDKLCIQIKQRKYTFYTHVLKVNINFQRKNKLQKTLPSSTTLYTFKSFPRRSLVYSFTMVNWI